MLQQAILISCLRQCVSWLATGHIRITTSVVISRLGTNCGPLIGQIQIQSVVMWYPGSVERTSVHLQDIMCNAPIHDKRSDMTRPLAVGAGHTINGASGQT